MDQDSGGFKKQVVHALSRVDHVPSVWLGWLDSVDFVYNFRQLPFLADKAGYGLVKSNRKTIGTGTGHLTGNLNETIEFE